MKVFNGIGELEKAVGTHLGHSGWHTVAQDQINRFGQVTGDHQWIHVDQTRAATGPFGSTVAHGYLTLSLVPKLTGQIYRIDGLTLAVNYGTNKVRFPAPVPVGSRIRAAAKLLALSRGDSSVQEIVRVTIERERGDKPACVAEIVTMLVD